MSERRPRAVITGAGVVSALGADRHQLVAALAAGASALHPPRRCAEATPAPLAAGLVVGEILDFAAERDLGPEGNLRPLDRAARLVTVAAARALIDCGTARDHDHAATGLAVGTTFGSLSTIAEFDRRQLTAGPRYVKPLDFANTVINAAAGQAAIWLDLEGINATFAGGTPAALEAVSFAADQVTSGRAELILAGGVEELAAEAVLTYAAAGLLAGGDGGAARAIPFGRDRNGFALAEGAALLAIEEAGRARARGATARATVLGCGSAFGDEPEALGRAVAAALGEAGLAARDLGVWVASASGSRELDRREAWGVWQALAGAAPPVTAPKAGLGDALGGSGALALATLVAVLESGTLPGIPGYVADPELPPIDAATGPRQIAARYGLVTALALDGQATALVLARGDEA